MGGFVGAAGSTTAAVFGALALVAYALSAAFYVAHLRTPRPLVGKAATTFVILGAACNLEALYARSVALHSVPYRDLLGSMALLGFFLAVLNVVLELRHHDRSLGPFLMPVVLVLLVLALELPVSRAAAPRPELRGSVFALHVTLNMLGYAAYAVSCALAVLYLAVGRSLKKRGRALDGAASRLPSLGYLERASRTSLGVGVVASAIGFGLGIYWASHVWYEKNPAWALDPKVWAAFLILGFYAVTLVRAHRGASPVTTARLVIAGFALVVFSYTAVNLFLTRLHSFT